jgi:hypothetical protein
MKDSTYQFIVGVLDLLLWGGKLVGEENLPRSGPAVFIANHLDTTGPIAVCSSIPLRLHPWIISNMMDTSQAPVYLEEDFIERQLHLKPPVSQWIAQAICKITIPLFHSLGCIPVYRHDYEGIRKTMKMSLAILQEEEFILLFPEDPSLPVDPVTKMNPFLHGFSRLGEMYYAETGDCLRFYPVTIHSSKQIIVGKSIAFNPLNPTGMERRRLKDLIERTITATYMQLEGGNASGVLTTERK